MKKKIERKKKMKVAHVVSLFPSSSFLLLLLNSERVIRSEGSQQLKLSNLFLASFLAYQLELKG